MIKFRNITFDCHFNFQHSVDSIAKASITAEHTIIFTILPQFETNKMANYNKNDRNKGYFDQYVNFDQFLMQHNINNWSPLRSPPSGFAQQHFNPYNNTPFHSYNDPMNTVQVHPNSGPSTSAGGAGSSNWVQNSNLTASATEFIPQQTSSTATNTFTLLATANEFVPRNQQGFDKMATNESKQSNSTLCDMGKNDTIAPKVTDENTSKTNFVIEALNNTHISDGKNTEESKTLNSSGGAIKKVRSQDYRNDSRERHPNGEFFNCIVFC